MVRSKSSAFIILYKGWPLTFVFLPCLSVTDKRQPFGSWIVPVPFSFLIGPTGLLSLQKS